MSLLKQISNSKVVQTLRRQLTAVGQNLLITETEENRSVATCCFLINGHIQLNDLIQLFNEKLVNNYSRFASIVVSITCLYCVVFVFCG